MGYLVIFVGWEYSVQFRGELLYFLTDRFMQSYFAGFFMGMTLFMLFAGYFRSVCGLGMYYRPGQRLGAFRHVFRFSDSCSSFPVSSGMALFVCLWVI